MIKLVECPRDAMQGISNWIPTDLKIKYLDQLLKIGFHTLDCGSFVSPKAVPQMKDTFEVLEKIDIADSKTKLLVIVANQRGAKEASAVDIVDYLGFPFSISETFQKRNTNSTIEESYERVKSIVDIANKGNKEVVIYISMGFGNPYGDTYNLEIAAHWVDKIAALGVKIISLSDTVGVADPEKIGSLFSLLVPTYTDVEFGAHLHSAPHNWRVKIETAYNHGCKRFDTAIHGYGGCPMASDDLIGNMATEHLINFFHAESFQPDLNIAEFEHALRMARSVFA